MRADHYNQHAMQYFVQRLTGGVKERALCKLGRSKLDLHNELLLVWPISLPVMLTVSSTQLFKTTLQATPILLRERHSTVAPAELTALPEFQKMFNSRVQTEDVWWLSADLAEVILVTLHLGWKIETSRKRSRGYHVKFKTESEIGKRGNTPRKN